MDTAIANDAPNTAVHLYAADADCALDDPEQWAKANPAIGKFRSLDDMRRQVGRRARDARRREPLPELGAQSTRRRPRAFHLARYVAAKQPSRLDSM